MVEFLFTNQVVMGLNPSAMDENLWFLDMLLTATFDLKGVKTVKLRTTGNKNWDLAFCCMLVCTKYISTWTNFLAADAYLQKPNKDPDRYLSQRHGHWRYDGRHLEKEDHEISFQSRIVEIKVGVFFETDQIYFNHGFC